MRVYFIFLCCLLNSIISNSQELRMERIELIANNTLTDIDVQIEKVGKLENTKSEFKTIYLYLERKTNISEVQPNIQVSENKLVSSSIKVLRRDSIQLKQSKTPNLSVKPTSEEIKID